MSELKRNQVKTNLDKYLDDLYHNELEFKIGKAEVNFIKHGVEHLVDCITDALFDNGSDIIDEIKDEYEDAYPALDFHDDHDRVVKLGNFYEKTQNGYPDEFEFIIVLFTFLCEDNTRHGYSKFGYTYQESLKELHQVLERLLAKTNGTDELVYENPEEQDGQISFRRYVGKSGSSSQLRFIYSKGDTEKLLHVCIDFGIRRLDADLELRELASEKAFNAEVAKIGSILYVDDKISFAETEKHFMKHVLSAKHRKAFRILQYLVNGLDDGKLLESCLRKAGLSGGILTTRMIRTELILHHFRCNSQGSVVSPCVMEILALLTFYDSNAPLPSLTHDPHSSYFFRSVDKQCALEEILDKLKAMHGSRERYRYERDTVVPIARSLLTYPKPQAVEWDESTKASDWVFCVGTYSINILQAVFAIVLFAFFISCLVYLL